MKNWKFTEVRGYVTVKQIEYAYGFYIPKSFLNQKIWILVFSDNNETVLENIMMEKPLMQGGTAMVMSPKLRPFAGKQIKVAVKALPN
jgi:hypothetical protein